jgi:hypothetical protein
LGLFDFLPVTEYEFYTYTITTRNKKVLVQQCK